MTLLCVRDVEKKSIEVERERLRQEEAEMQASKQRNEVEETRKALERKLELETQITQRAQLRAAEVQETIHQQQASIPNIDKHLTFLLT